MAEIPSIDNYTVAGGVKLFFDDGTGERDLGNLTKFDIEPSTDELEHFSNRSGKRMKDDGIVITEKLSFKFSFDEVVINNLKYFFKGGDLENVGAGTGTVVDQKVALTGTILQSLGKYGLSAVTVRQFLDYCLLEEAGGVFVDDSIEADSAAGSPFALLVDPANKRYFGKKTKFNQVFVDITGVGNYTTPAFKYWNGTTWSPLVVAGAGDGFTVDGKITFTPPVDWAQTTVYGKTGYFVQFSCAAIVADATVVAIRQNGVANTDYILDAGLATGANRIVGRVGRLASGIFEDGEEVKVSFTYTTWTATQFSIAGSSFIQGAARLEVHPAAGRGIQFDIEIPKCQLKPQGNISLDDSKWMEVPMTLEVLDNSSVTPTYPFGRYISYE